MRACWAICLTLAVLGVPALVHADNAPLARFFGAFEGQTVFQDGEAAPRDLSVVIRSFGAGGFTIRWRTIIFDPEAEARGRSQVIYFQPRPGQDAVFAATESEDAAGSASDDPLDGRPFAWARISGDTLTVNLLTITETGGYVVQTYDRRLTAEGLALAFHRVRDGVSEHRLFGILRRVDE